MWHPIIDHTRRSRLITPNSALQNLFPQSSFPQSLATPFSRIFKSTSVLVASVLAIFLFTLGAIAQDAPIPPPPPPDPQQQFSQPAQQQPSAESDVRAVRLSDVEGKVQVLNGGDPAFDQAQQNMPVLEGMRLVTAADGRVEIQFEDGSVARVTPNSSITLSQLHRKGDGSTVTVIDATAGLTYYELNGRAGQYTVHFGPNTVTPTDSSIFRVNLDGNPTELAVTHGTVHISDGQSLALDVHTNQSIRFDSQSSSQYELIQSVSADTWDQWNSDRDQVLASLEESASTARASTGNPDDPGWNDLDYYGDWYDVPGYGMAWAPSGVGTNWDPFGVGSWGYYSGIGYSWISGYPWGWWPYHCGAWNFFDNYGWMWFPGNCGYGAFGAGGWYAYSTVWHCPPGYRPPVRPGNPVHGTPPLHGRPPIRYHEPLIAVNRGPEFTQQFRTVGGSKPAPRSFDFEGKTIAPAEAIIHPRTVGPIGESFTSSTVRTHPEVLDGSFVRSTAGSSFGERPTYQSGAGGRSYTPPAYNPRPVATPYSGGGGHIAAPGPSGGGHVSAPPPAAGHPR
jgi:ferric-dicitrate binding protein FerR (iron transport regulator)